MECFQAGQAFDERRLALRGGAEGFADHRSQRLLQQEGGEQDERYRHKGRDSRHAAYPPDEAEEQDEEGQVDQGRDRSRGDEFAEGFEFLQAARKGADRRRPRFQADAHDFLEDVGRQDDVDLLAGDIDEIAAQAAHDEVEDINHADADREHP